MKFKSINFIFVCTMLLMLNACTKESNTLETLQTTTPISTENDMALQIKEYYPPEEVDVTEKVLGFLNHTKTNNPEASFKTEFKDMEVNEAMFTLEAASNYLVNKNFKYEYDSEKIEIDVDFQTVVNNRTHIIEGKVLTKIFDNLMQKITIETNTIKKLPKLVDFKLLQNKEKGSYFKVFVSLVKDRLIDESLLRKYNIEVSEPFEPEVCDDSGIMHPVWNWGNACASGRTNHFRIHCNCLDTFPYDKLGSDGFHYDDGMREILSCIHNHLASEMNNALNQVDDFLWFLSVVDVYDNISGVNNCTQKAFSGFEHIPNLDNFTGVVAESMYLDMLAKTINFANRDICNSQNVNNRPRMPLEIFYDTHVENDGNSSESVCIQYVTMAEAVLVTP